ncbi:glycosyltransferase [Flavobacterium salilacus subsp. salilacus]|uniref:glycosyltransferase n=1 Tax=Flavobacterium TaxID=237 RepID=UPI0013C34BA3|nr:MULTISPECIES: glycosyltransferase [Flavobacterium]KAF2518987.1 glycosyltransferase [Flavobacterium salilacus subsp. salilacus]MBE1614850.1 glycosyltransferase [Flavobacterium sp. SaA2.13]
MQKVAIIIPCYNEEKRIDKTMLSLLVSLTEADIFLCNDGSTDNTLQVLNDIAGQIGNRCVVIHYAKNAGKANTIYKSVNDILNRGEYTHIGYFDADFSTPVEEIVKLLDIQHQNLENFIMGSRVMLLNSQIKRKTYRHIIGRVIVTLVNLKFKLGVYDTQCGAKLFPVAIAKIAFSQPFRTSWLFDMEIFLRLKKNNLMHTGKEIPLQSWRDVDGSKLNWKDSFKILRELYLLYTKGR